MRKIAIYPGSFNPFTIGHLNVLEKAEAIFGKENVIIAPGINPDKNQSGTDIVATIQQNLPTRNVEGFSGLLTDFVWKKEQEGSEVVIIKGLRNGDDLSYEMNQLRYLQDLKPDLKVIFIVCDVEFGHISSSGYRALEKIRPGLGHKYLAKEPESNYIVFIDHQSIDNYAMMIDAPKNEEYLYKRVKVFRGTKSECEVWKKENPYEEFDESKYDIGMSVSYDREHWTLAYINEKICHLTFKNEKQSGGTFVQRIDAPWIWKDCKKK